jgi:hypothetical protein
VKSTFRVLDIIYQTINVSAVRTTLDGRVYRNSRPENLVTRDITIGALPITGNGGGDLQECVIIINCFAKDIAPGIPDDSNLDKMTAAVLTALEGYTDTTVYLNPEINSQGCMADIDQAGISYSSIRLNCTIQTLTV